MKMLPNSILRTASILLCILGIGHFWIALVNWTSMLIVLRDFPVGPAHHSCIVDMLPPIILLLFYLTAYRIATEHGLSRRLFFALVVLPVTLFCHDVSSGKHQGITPVMHKGEFYSVFTLGYRYHYFTWWWYRDIEYFPGINAFIDSKK